MLIAIFIFCGDFACFVNHNISSQTFVEFSAKHELLWARGLWNRTYITDLWSDIFSQLTRAWRVVVLWPYPGTWMLLTGILLLTTRHRFPYYDLAAPYREVSRAVIGNIECFHISYQQTSSKQMNGNTLTHIIHELNESNTIVLCKTFRLITCIEFVEAKWRIYA